MVGVELDDSGGVVTVMKKIEAPIDRLSLLGLCGLK